MMQMVFEDMVDPPPHLYSHDPSHNLRVNLGHRNFNAGLKKYVLRFLQSSLGTSGPPIEPEESEEADGRVELRVSLEQLERWVEHHKGERSRRNRAGAFPEGGEAEQYWHEWGVSQMMREGREQGVWRLPPVRRNPRETREDVMEAAHKLWVEQMGGLGPGQFRSSSRPAVAVVVQEEEEGEAER